MPASNIPASNSPQFLALGDSYSIGEGMAAPDRWPEQLAARLRHDGAAVGAPRIIAVTGWTTQDLSAGMDAADLQQDWALVTLQIGVNNQYRGQGAAIYRPQFAALLDRAIALAGGRARHVLVVSIPDWGVTRFAREQGRDPERIAYQLDTYNAIARDETRRRDAHWVDITPLSRRLGGQSDMFAEDGLHPSASQYAQWVKRIEPFAREALRRSSSG